MTPLEMLRYHVSGAIERGEAEPIVEVTMNRAVATINRQEQDMNVIIKQSSDKTYPNTGRYVMASMSCGNHDAVVMISQHEVRVVVENAMNRAWRGMGKGFRSVDEAIDNYKTPEIRSMIRACADLAS